MMPDDVLANTRAYEIRLKLLKLAAANAATDLYREGHLHGQCHPEVVSIILKRFLDI